MDGIYSSMLEGYRHSISVTGQDFRVTRDENTFTVRGRINSKEQRLIFLPDTDVQENDELTAVLTEKKFYVVDVEHKVAEDKIYAIYALYETDRSRIKQQQAKAPTYHIENAQGSIINIESELNHVSQTISNLAQSTEEDKAELTRLVSELNEALKEVTTTQPEEAEKVTKRVQIMVDEIDKSRPDKELVTFSRESLLTAARNLAAVVPVILPIAEQIAARVQHMLP